MISFNVLALAVFTFLVIHQGQCMQFAITPMRGTESLTQEVTFSCRTDIAAPSVPSEIVLIQISRGDHVSMALLRSDGKISYGADSTSKLEGNGQIDNLGVKGGYLNVTMHFPHYDDTGIYKCHVVFLDDMGVVNHYSNDAYLDVDKPSFSKTEAKVQSLEALLLDVNRRVQELNTTNLMKKDSVHAFSATISKQGYYIRNKMTIVFDEVITQQGQGYDARTGIFTAPVTGLYAFFLVLEMEEKGAGGGFSLQTTTNREFARLYVEDKEIGDQSSVSTVVKLTAGEKVRVAVSYKNKLPGFLYHNKYCVFSGFLIHPF